MGTLDGNGTGIGPRWMEDQQSYGGGARHRRVTVYDTFYYIGYGPCGYEGNGYSSDVARQWGGGSLDDLDF